MGNSLKSLKQIQDLLKIDGKVKFKIKVSANSKSNSIDFCEEFIKVRIKERAIEGRANKAIIDFFSDLLKCPKSKISILNGDKSSIKTLEIIK